jgi:hypothetical protein
MAEDGGHVITLFVSYPCKYFILSYLEARGSNPCFDGSYPMASADVLLEGIREQAERRGLLRMAVDVITFVITSHTFVAHCILQETTLTSLGQTLLSGPQERRRNLA